jgi:hypothetical protein
MSSCGVILPHADFSRRSEASYPGQGGHAEGTDGGRRAGILGAACRYEQANMGMTEEVTGPADATVFPYLLTVSRRGRIRPHPAQPSQSAQTIGCPARSISGGISTARPYPAANTQNPSIQAINGRSQHRIRGGENARGQSLDLTRPVIPAADHQTALQHTTLAFAGDRL